MRFGFAYICQTRRFACGGHTDTCAREWSVSPSLSASSVVFNAIRVWAKTPHKVFVFD
jgi:hypothetical protein